LGIISNGCWVLIFLPCRGGNSVPNRREGACAVPKEKGDIHKDPHVRSSRGLCAKAKEGGRPLCVLFSLHCPVDGAGVTVSTIAHHHCHTTQAPSSFLIAAAIVASFRRSLRASVAVLIGSSSSAGVLAFLIFKTFFLNFWLHVHTQAASTPDESGETHNIGILISSNLSNWIFVEVRLLRCKIARAFSARLICSLLFQHYGSAQLARDDVISAPWWPPELNLSISFGFYSYRVPSAIKVANDFIATGSVGLIGPMYSSETVTVQVALSCPVPQVGISATSTTLSDKETYPSFMRVVPADDIQVEAMIALLISQNVSQIATICVRDDYGLFGSNNLQESGARQGLRVSSQ
jgi:hypothetical protein